MYLLLYFILPFFICFFSKVQAENDFSLPPCMAVHGINLLTGEAESSLNNNYLYEYKNKKIKKITPKNPLNFQAIEFIYNTDYTEVTYDKDIKDIYYFDAKGLITKVEHFLSRLKNEILYRTDRFFWCSSNEHPTLAKKIIEDGHGCAHICYLCDFSATGQLIKETLVGNLSGHCEQPLIIQANGDPLENGVESYSVSYEYDSEHPELLTKRTEENGMTAHYQYDSSQRCVAKLSGNAFQLSARYFYEYDNCGLLSKTTVDDGQSFDENDLTGVTVRKIMDMQSSHDLKNYGQPLLIENKFYDLNSAKEALLDRMISIYSSDGELIQQEFYDANGNFTHSTNGAQDQNVTLTSPQENYELGKRLQTSIDKFGNESFSYYDSLGRAIKTILPLVLDENDQAYSPQIQQTFNVLDQITSTEDQEGNKTFYTYTIRNQPATIKYPDGSFESYVYHQSGQLKEKIERNGNKTIFCHDPFGRVISKQLFSRHGIKLSELYYTYQGDLQHSVTDNQSFTLRYTYDGAGRKIGYEYENKDGKIQQNFKYDSLNQLVNLEIDELNPPTALQETPLSEENVYLYKNETYKTNNQNQIVKVVETHDQNGCKEFVTYDALERPENRIRYNSMGIKISEVDIRHNAQGHKIQEIHHRLYQGDQIGEYKIQWKYDPCGRLIKICEAAGTPYEKTTRYDYNSFGQLQKLIQPNGASLSYTYDEKGLLHVLSSSDDSIHYVYEYDEVCHLIKIADKITNRTQLHTYDGFNQLTEISHDECTIRYEYDDMGRCIRMILPDSTSVRYLYEQNQVKTIERLAADESILYSHRYEYDQTNHLLLTSHLIKDLGPVNYQYDLHKKLTGISSQWWSQYIPKEGLDSVGRKLSTQIRDPLGSYEQVFHYTQDGQLTENANEYDSLFNPVLNQNQKWHINEINQLIENAHYQFIYDKNGNLVKKYNDQECHSYCYDALNRLNRYENNTHAITYCYDTFNRRITEQVFEKDENKEGWIAKDSYRYLYDGMNEIGKLDSQGQIIELRILGAQEKAEIGATIAMELYGKVLVPIHDLQGSVRCLIDVDSAEMSEFYRYTSFGQQEIYNQDNEMVTHSTVNNPWRYFSKRFDELTQLVFFGLRYYDSSISRWTTPDPCFFCDTPNLYTFVKNDPLNHYDLQGLFSLSTLWNSGKETISSCYNYLKLNHKKIRESICAEFQLPTYVSGPFERIGQKIIGKFSLLLGYEAATSHNGVYGEKEFDKVRITFINGVLSTDRMLLENLDLISESHGGAKVHYVFRGTKGWTADMGEAVVMRTCYYPFGYRSEYAYHLADTWRSLIQEMGGVEGGGIIIHYAHSLGGCDTDRARTLLTAEEQKMIRVFSFGSATMIRNQGFQNVVNMISANDGVSSIILEPLGRIRNYFDPKTNVRVYGSFSPFYYFSDHLLRGFTYRLIVEQLGQNFIDEFGHLAI